MSICHSTHEYASDDKLYSTCNLQQRMHLVQVTSILQCIPSHESDLLFKRVYGSRMKSSAIYSRTVFAGMTSDRQQDVRDLAVAMESPLLAVPYNIADSDRSWQTADIPMTFRHAEGRSSHCLLAWRMTRCDTWTAVWVLCRRRQLGRGPGGTPVSPRPLSRNLSGGATRQI